MVWYCAGLFDLIYSSITLPSEFAEATKVDVVVLLCVFLFVPIVLGSLYVFLGTEKRVWRIGRKSGEEVSVECIICTEFSVDSVTAYWFRTTRANLLLLLHP